MSDEETKQPEGQAEVIVNDEGTPEVSDNDLLEAVGLTDEAEPREEKQPEKQPEAKKEEPAKPPEKTETPKRKIKWQGQEVEVEPDKETELIQKGYDYTQKMQALAAERDLLTPHIGVLKAMEQDPALRQKIAEHLTGTPTKTESPKFDDPIEELEWKIEQKVLKRVQDEHITPLKQQAQQLTHQQALDQVRTRVQADPLYQEVQGAIIKEVQSLPPSVSKNVYNQYDQDPQAYLEAYKIKREAIVASKKQTTTPEKKPLPEPTKREEHAPILESARSAPTEAEARGQSESLKTLNKKARGGDLHALGELLLKGEMLKGIID